MGSYPLMQTGNQYLIVVTDMMSHWVEVKAIHRANTEMITWYLEEKIFPCWGYPEALLMDNGKLLRGHMWRWVCDRFHIKVWTTANYHPWANPMECHNGEIKKVLWM